MENEKRLIDAKATIKRLNKRREDLAGGWKTLDAMPTDAQIQYHENLECALIVEDAPTVDAVEVVHGRWIDRPSMKGQVYCSECATIEKSTDSNYKSRRCPNCGAKMDGGNEDG